MTSMAKLAAQTAVEIDHMHPRPDFKKPWWYWACLQCTPGLYQAVTRPEVDFDESKIVCPYCHEKANVGRGAMLLHYRYGEICPASGMSRVTAGAMIEAQMNRASVADMLRWARFTSAEEVSVDPEPVPLNPVLQALRDAMGRGRDQMTTRELARRIGAPEETIYKWWRGWSDTSPRFDVVFLATAELGLEIVFEHRLGDVVVRSQEEFHERSLWLRKELDMDGDAMGERLGLTGSVVRRREKNQTRVSLARCCEWAEALEGRLIARKKVVVDVEAR